jgi:hypothetical protein
MPTDGNHRVARRGTGRGPTASDPRMDDDEREAIRAEGLDPDDPAVRAALDLVRWELELLVSERPRTEFRSLSVDWVLDAEAELA